MDAKNNLHEQRRASLPALTIGALGVVYGDIGTSPLYTIKETFNREYGIPPVPENVLGILSLIFIALIITVTLKYIVFMMRVDNHGEGGIMALMALTLRKLRDKPQLRNKLMLLGLFGAALFYGDGLITPAISVLSAVEGLNLATPVFTPYVLPITIAILVALFLLQRKGTASVGALFGPIMCLWFFIIGILGFLQILHEPSVLLAINPYHGIRFFVRHQWQGFFVLGAVVLAITGVEALYADMGHFGRRSIRFAWMWLVLPALLLNYFGQGALIIHNSDSVINPFYLLVPSWGLYPMVILSTVATIIASQAVISGTFSLTRQAIQLGYAPPMKIFHTSEKEIGQIYIPAINNLMLVLIIGLVLYFPSSSALASAYGFAVTGTMLITTLLACVVVHKLWHWHWLWRSLLMSCFLLVDIAFFSATTMKINKGGWFPLLLAICIFTLLTTWKRGREILAHRLRTGMTFEHLMEKISHERPRHVSGTAIYLTASHYGVAPTLLHNLDHNKVLHKRVVFLTVTTRHIPRVKQEKRIKVENLGHHFYRLIIYYGFKDLPNIPNALQDCEQYGLSFDLQDISFFLGRATLIPLEEKYGMVLWREKLFVWMAQNAASATSFLNIPVNQVIELGTQVEL